MSPKSNLTTIKNNLIYLLQNGKKNSSLGIVIASHTMLNILNVVHSKLCSEA